MRLKKLLFLFILTLFILSSSQAFAQIGGGWKVQKTGMALAFMGVDFLNAREGWVAGLHSTKGGVIFRTIDGGITWKEQTNNYITNLMIFDIAMASSRVGWVAGMGVFWYFPSGAFTETGGIHWTGILRGYLATAFQDMAVIDSKNVWLAGFWAKGQTSGTGVIMTKDGGKNWTEVDWGIDTEARYIHFIDANTGWISGGTFPTEETEEAFYSEAPLGFPISKHFRVKTTENTKFNMASGYRGVIAKTTDGGKTWVKQFDNAGAFYFNGIYFTDSQNGWVVGEGDNMGVIYYTSDGGNTWVEQYRSPNDNIYSLLQIQMINTKEGWAVGGKGGGPTGMKTLILHTEDGGNTWKDESINSTMYLFDLDFPVANEGWAVGTNTGQAGILHYKK